MHPFTPIFDFFHLKFISPVSEFYAMQKRNRVVPFSRCFCWVLFCLFLYSYLISCYISLLDIKNSCPISPHGNRNEGHLPYRSSHFQLCISLPFKLEFSTHCHKFQRFLRALNTCTRLLRLKVRILFSSRNWFYENSEIPWKHNQKA